MNRVWNEVKAGWKEARWISFFSIYLILFISLVVLIDNVIKGELSTPPGILQILLAASGALISYFLARLHVKKTQSKYFGVPPGESLLAIVDFTFSPTRIELTFKPIVADWRHEYFEAIVQGRNWKARWISLRYSWAFISAICLSPVLSLVKHLRAVSKKG